MSRHSHPWSAIALVALLLTAQASTLAAATARALLIGINEYEQPGAPAAPGATGAGSTVLEDRPSPTRGGPGQTGSTDTRVVSSWSPGRGAWTNLDGAVNDATAFAEILVSRYGFGRSDVRVLLNGDATRKRILAEIQTWLLDPAKAGDTCVFFYAGHGSQVTNSLSPETDRRDETLVPVDSWTGAMDVRDKELARLFNRLLDKKVTLTAILDSCHSGSIARGFPAPGKTRYLAPDPRDARDAGDKGPSPEQRGALILSAAQDDQVAGEQRDARGDPHGRFSAALIATLASAPICDPAEQIYRRVRARMQAEGSTQEPVLAGTGRRDRPLFGQARTGELAGRTLVAALKAWDDGQIDLQGGRAVGLGPGCELTRVRGSSGAPVRLRVTTLEGLGRCQASLVTGKPTDVQPGDLFQIESWAIPDEAAVKVWIPAAPPDRSRIDRVAREMSVLTTSSAVRWVADPTDLAPTHVLGWTGSTWAIRPAGPGKALVDLGVDPTARSVLSRLAGGATRPSLFVHLPPPTSLVAELGLGPGTRKGAVEATGDPAGATYFLVGRVVAGGVEYAWVLPGAAGEDARQGLPLPVRTDWLPVSTEPEGCRRAGLNLKELIQRVGKLKAWLQLEGPPDPGTFPYRLVMKNLSDGKANTSGVVVKGERYALWLRARPEDLKNPVEKRYVYLFSLDSFGRGTLLFPRVDSGNVENRIPPGAPDKDGYPVEIPLNRTITVGPPYGTDTSIVLTSDEALPPDLFDFEGVRTRGGPTGPAASPLTRLLSSVGAVTRGMAVAAPATWSVHRYPVLSVESASPAPGRSGGARSGNEAGSP